MSKKKRPIPLAPPQMKSRKKARKVTSIFHKLTQQLDQARKNNDKEAVDRIEKEIEKMGGRQEYQRASQLSTKYHSTSKWVLKILGQKGWTNGMVTENGTDADADVDADVDADADTNDTEKDPRKRLRPTYILEIGAINTELIDASKKTKLVWRKSEQNESSQTKRRACDYRNVPVHNIKVKAIDLHSSHPDIEEVDFLKMAVENETQGTFDVIVCSMVLNCVTTAEDRGTMLSLMYKQLRPGGLCFLTIPRLCINQSKYINRKVYEEILTNALGFMIEEKKETPKVAFWILKRPSEQQQQQQQQQLGIRKDVTEWNIQKWETASILHPGPKYRNNFAVTLKRNG
jgi:25S rRNA (adenine2142-N1)-methyltransferase